jgi:hypothetical protein
MSTFMSYPVKNRRKKVIVMTYSTRRDEMGGPDQPPYSRDVMGGPDQPPNRRDEMGGPDRLSSKRDEMSSPDRAA